MNLFIWQSRFLSKVLKLQADSSILLYSKMLEDKRNWKGDYEAKRKEKIEDLENP